MNWIGDRFGTHKPAIVMCHLRALPGDPGYDAAKGIDSMLEKARADLHALQAGGGNAETATHWDVVKNIR